MKAVVFFGLVAGCNALFNPAQFFPSLFPVVSSLPKASGSLCGGRGGQTCAEGYQCRYRPGECGESDASGTCVLAVPFCLLPGSPVCGCDGKTYNSSCLAYVAGTNVKNFHPCGSDEPDAPVGNPKFIAVPFFAPPPSRPPPVYRPECSSDSECGSGTYCLKYSCSGMSGYCVNVPDFCTKEFSPVCGCDGNTYGNKCELARARQSVMQRGSCPEPGLPFPPIDIFPSVPKAVDFPSILPTLAPNGNRPEVCGGFIGRPCSDPRALCVNAPGACFGADFPGFCVIPSAVPNCGGPVCGCRGGTFKNMCEAWKSGDGIASIGPCGGGEPAGPPRITPSSVSLPQWRPFSPSAIPRLLDPPALGASDGKCEGDDDCNFDEVCVTAEGDCGSVGTCRKRPTSEECDGMSSFVPVCGCNGQTYPSPCIALMSGVSVLGLGKCVDAPGVPKAPAKPSSEDTCADSTDCADSWYCDLSENECGTLTGVPGVCRPRPTECASDGESVCGCDFVTYTSECAANAAGASVVPGWCFEGADPFIARLNKLSSKK